MLRIRHTEILIHLQTILAKESIPGVSAILSSEMLLNQYYCGTAARPNSLSSSSMGFPSSFFSHGKRPAT